jgi:hypothetical protein
VRIFKTVYSDVNGDAAFGEAATEWRVDDLRVSHGYPNCGHIPPYHGVRHDSQDARRQQARLAGSRVLALSELALFGAQTLRCPLIDTFARSIGGDE